MLNMSNKNNFKNEQEIINYISKHYMEGDGVIYIPLVDATLPTYDSYSATSVINFILDCSIKGSAMLLSYRHKIINAISKGNKMEAYVKACDILNHRRAELFRNFIDCNRHEILQAAISRENYTRG